MTAPGLIINADDFGLHSRVNLAVERAFARGVLTSASLMVGAPAAREAVDIAKRHPALRVGLHIVLADGRAVSAPPTIASIVDRDGMFPDAMAREGVRFFFSPRARRELAREIRAQFEAFAATGLALDHVNTHKHFHLHPTVLSQILAIGREFGMRAMRVPCEPDAPWALRPWLALTRARLARAGIAHNRFVVGMRRTGAMDEQALLAALDDLPDGLNEIYLHPAVAGDGPITPTMRDYRHADELTALLSPRVKAALDRLALPRGGFADFIRT
ncbi:hopanoid biosynthesis-associated protein HpnK [Pararobbsia silviterrae]|uniref:ChbG/HpnK family deacetylase n=1 Tax=Pararobbsia silviterrae TaxID=1792498 RepID=A0A494XW47_9BURK|nr:hopanoid biosynthesis-associated protein HpnK [Pararobbsia silviterrae]RKP51813.1 ChbG/HpnK family deacetylase [Pararobbsia silviterrae]